MSANIGIRRVTAALTLLTIGLVAAAGDTARAHEVRFVASYGSGNLCTREAPCASLQRGINRTPAGGELIILDSGDFGNSAVIDKSITVSAVGVSATLGGGITIDATDATVVLRGLRLNGAGSAGNGIDITSGAAGQIYIEDGEIQGFAYGIHVNSGAYPTLVVAKTVARNNSSTGLHFQTGSPGRLIVDNSRFENNGGDGIEVRAAEASITRAILSGNASSGVRVTFNGKANVTWTTAEHNAGSGYAVDGSGQMTLEQSVARGNADGVRASAGSGSQATVRISNSVVTNNGADLAAAGSSTLLSRGNNTIGDGTWTLLTALSGI
jgi:hypothetical protein